MNKIFYFSAVRGITEQETGAEVVYYGKVLRIPRDVFTKGEHKEIEEAFLKELEEGTWGAKDSYPAPDGTIERYEVFEAETGDVLIMYRVPYLSPKPKPGYVH